MLQAREHKSGRPDERKQHTQVHAKVQTAHRANPEVSGFLREATWRMPQERIDTEDQEQRANQQQD